MDRAIGDRGAVRVVQTLDALKRTGSNILLVGSSVTGAHEMACRRLCGHADADRRYRLVVTDERRPMASCDHDDRGNVRSIIYDAPETTAAPTAERDPAERSSRSPDPLEALGLEVIDAIDAIESEADGLGPSELRVCVDSLATLFQEHDTESVFRLVHVVSSRIEQAGGMGHYHLPVAADHEAVRLLEPMFDATVELRGERGGYEQRWSLDDRGLETDWVPL
ncbi:DUF7504 family protein [Natrarchaeobaculum aegyptiacum]|uniref:KaiC-like domain-containing protein n=1 Tax=Natrarchaeobaculum aegyptiacum TaxID=745377 RepID=A0A2Z2HRL4_9EURY|nr:hypothetical protein [Natrarchaeobaculum aegyptiacum]ARS88715.1 hypothetical protein B1756_02380 [Natrarchaeobaculum aegyptiacum]